MEGKIAIVTGGTGGIGTATAALLLARGARVAIIGRSRERLEHVAGSLNAGDRLLPIQADVAIASEMETAVATTLTAFGGLDILVANAGTEGVVKPLLALTGEEFGDVQAVNLTGTFNSIKFAALAMQRQGGAIVATASVAALVGVAGLAAYTASKHGIAGLVKVAAIELAASNIRVNAVAPAPIDNDMMRSIERQAAPGVEEGQAKAIFSGLNPMQRYGRNEEVASAITFLASDDASFINGAILAVDGGLVIQ
ncbi:MAG: oxidoreductase [Sphingobium sp.]|uniref:SDR family NAD(P)-dependent oxidoreductase n=1 Tax=Sphingobium sp. TaxID=1912891 RepID=UPI000DAFEE30|nr:SDR family NAD(P)-dependent oxidoreductase [Sphingobium sp.]PZU12390.1 MAG: oxidoreductase [Sphingobium sp.]